MQEYLAGVETFGEELSYCGVPYVSGVEWIINYGVQAGENDLEELPPQDDGAEGSSRQDRDQSPRPLASGSVQLLTTVERSVCGDIEAMCRTMSQPELSPIELEKLNLLKKLMGFDPAMLQHLVSQVSNQERELGEPLSSSHVAAPFEVQADAEDTDPAPPSSMDDASRLLKQRLRRHSGSSALTDSSLQSATSERVTRTRTAKNKMSRVDLTGWSVDVCQLKGTPVTRSQLPASVQFKHAGPAVDGVVDSMKFTVMKVIPQNFKDLFFARVKTNGVERYITSPHDLSQYIDAIAEQYASYRSIEGSVTKA